MRNDYQISFKIIRDFETKKFKKIRLILIFCLILLPIFLYKLYQTIGEGIPFIIITILTIAVFIGLLIKLSNEPTWQKVGRLTMNPNRIIIKESNDIIELEMASIRKLTINYKGYELETDNISYSGSVTYKDGKNNILTIETDSYIKSYELFFDSLSQVKILNYLFKFYTSKGITATIYK
jgi:hypothetical protein